MGGQTSTFAASSEWLKRWGGTPLTPAIPVQQSSDPFQDAINRVGGQSIVGNPVGGQMRWVGSTVQDFSNGGALGIMMKADGTNIAYWINGDFLKEYYKHQVEVGILGAPTSDRFAFQGGWRQNFQGGMIIQRPTGIISVEPTIEAMNSKPVFLSPTKTPEMSLPKTSTTPSVVVPVNPQPTIPVVKEIFLPNDPRNPSYKPPVTATTPNVVEIYLPNDPRNPANQGNTGNSNNGSAIQAPNSGGTQTPVSVDGRSGLFDGIVKTNGLNIRSGPGTSYGSVGALNYGTRVTFDLWETGTAHYDQDTGKMDDRWFRIKDTNTWVASAYINGNPGSTPIIVSNNPSASKVDSGISDTASKDPSTNLKPAPQDPLSPETSPQTGSSGKGSLPSYMTSSDIYFSNIPRKELEDLKSDSAAASTTWKFNHKYGTDGAIKMLEQYKSSVIQAAENYGIDGRAIAGAIRWEYEKNWVSRINDYDAYSDVQKTGMLTILDPLKRNIVLFKSKTDKWSGTGWGKMHFTAASALLAREGKQFDNRQLAVLLAIAPTSIELIAKYMREAANIYQKFAGIDISYRPEILVTLYQGVSTDENINENPFSNIEIRAKELAGNRKINFNQQPQPNEQMGAWVVGHLNELAAYGDGGKRVSDPVFYA